MRARPSQPNEMPNQAAMSGNPMIEPVLSDQNLLEEIQATAPAAGSLAIWWLGQSGFLIKSSATTVLIDPYLSEHLTRKYENTARPHVRMTRNPIAPHFLSGIDHVLASHKHSDHFDPGTIPALLNASPNAILVHPESLSGHAESLGVASGKRVGLTADGLYQRRGVTVRAIPSAHEGLDTDERGHHLYLGFVIEVDGLRLYHSGDTLAYEGLAEAIGPAPVDVMFLPINGRDPARGVPGNMSATEAITLANVVRPRHVVPHHYDMFTFNTVPVGVFEDEARRLSPGILPQILRCGECWEVQR